MTRYANAPLVAALALAASCGSPEPITGPRVDVLFDERHDLEGDEPVRFLDFEIGRVESVELDRGRVRVRVAIGEAAAEGLTTETTFTVERSRRDRWLDAHVLDQDAAPLADGAELEGMDSEVELAVARTRAGASELAERVGSSDLVTRARDAVRDLRQAIAGVDLSDESEALAEQWEQTTEQLDAFAERTADEVASAAAELEADLEEFAEELDERGYREQAERLRSRLRELIEGQ